MATPILQVRGIGPSTAAILEESGIKTAEDLAGQTLGQVASIRTFSETRAGQVIAAAKELLAFGADPVETEKKSKSGSESKKVKKKADKEKSPKDKKEKSKKAEKPKKKEKKEPKKEKLKKKEDKKKKNKKSVKKKN